VKALLPALLLLAVAAPTASATDGFSLALSRSSSAVINQPVLVWADGKNPPPTEYGFTTWMEAVLLRPEVTPECPFSPGAATQVASATGGSTLTFAQRIDVDGDGRWRIPIGFTPIITARLLMCVYTVNEAGFPHASASLMVDVAGAAAPVNVTPPKVKRSGKALTCSHGRWSGATSFSYRWLVDGARRSRGRTLRVTRALRGHRVQCAVTAGGVTATSAPRA
jgi:hypothetical protein